ncbi:MAG: 1-deoxy-D-xylulose-5-phosphate reductoisomerase, partial [Candidatus Acidiferrales bacterium]
MKRISILGSTGSIGRQTLAVVDELAGQFEVVAIAAGSNIALVADQIARHRPQTVSVGSEIGALEL